MTKPKTEVVSVEVMKDGEQTGMTVSSGGALAVRDPDAERICQAYEEAKTGLKKIVICGLMLLCKKAELKHGQFQKWITEQCPEIPYRTAATWMQTADSALCAATGKESFTQICQSNTFLDIPVYKLLEMPPAELTEPAAKMQSDLNSLISGTTQKQLLLGFKNDEPLPGKYNPPTHTPAELEQMKVATANEHLLATAKALIRFDDLMISYAEKKAKKQLMEACMALRKRLKAATAKSEGRRV